MGGRPTAAGGGQQRRVEPGGRQRLCDPWCVHARPRPHSTCQGAPGTPVSSLRRSHCTREVGRQSGGRVSWVRRLRAGDVAGWPPAGGGKGPFPARDHAMPQGASLGGAPRQASSSWHRLPAGPRPLQRLASLLKLEVGQPYTSSNRCCSSFCLAAGHSERGGAQGGVVSMRACCVLVGAVHSNRCRAPLNGGGRGGRTDAIVRRFSAVAPVATTWPRRRAALAALGAGRLPCCLRTLPASVRIRVQRQGSPDRMRSPASASVAAGPLPTLARAAACSAGGSTCRRL